MRLEGRVDRTSLLARGSVCPQRGCLFNRSRYMELPKRVEYARGGHIARAAAVARKTPCSTAWNSLITY